MIQVIGKRIAYIITVSMDDEKILGNGEEKGGILSDGGSIARKLSLAPGAFRHRHSGQSFKRLVPLFGSHSAWFGEPTAASAFNSWAVRPSARSPYLHLIVAAFTAS
jgi:hypothetical protein